MAKVTFEFEDGFKDGKAVVKARYETAGVPEPDGGPAPSTPAQLFGATVKRLWDVGALGSLLRIIVPDLIYQNQMIEKRAAMLASALPAIPTPPVSDVDGAATPAAVNDADNNTPVASPSAA